MNRGGKDPHQDARALQGAAGESNGELTELGRRLPWLNRATATTLPEVFLRVGALVLESGGRLIIPYRSEYTEKALDQADKVGLVPAIAAGLA